MRVISILRNQNVGQYDISHKETILNTYMSHTTRYANCYVNETHTKPQQQTSTGLPVPCFCLHDVNAHNEQDILTFFPLSKITCILYIRHIPYHTLDTNHLYQITLPTSVCNLSYIATSISACGNFPSHFCSSTLNVIPT